MLTARRQHVARQPPRRSTRRRVGCACSEGSPSEERRPSAPVPRQHRAGNPRRRPARAPPAIPAPPDPTWAAHLLPQATRAGFLIVVRHGLARHHDGRGHGGLGRRRTDAAPHRAFPGCKEGGRVDVCVGGGGRVDRGASPARALWLPPAIASRRSAGSRGGSESARAPASPFIRSSIHSCMQNQASSRSRVLNTGQRISGAACGRVWGLDITVGFRVCPPSRRDGAQLSFLRGGAGGRGGTGARAKGHTSRAATAGARAARPCGRRCPTMPS